jgi:predicted cobalt transporter CbtA
MAGLLLLRGMLVGLVAGLLCFGFLKIAGEPSVEKAIAFESQMNEARHNEKADAAVVKGMVMPKEEPEAELVTRSVQSGAGLLTGIAVYSAAFGGLFALAFALAYGRLGNLGPRAVSAVLAGAGFIAVYVVPSLKYPANPPSVGEAETIGLRTALYFAMILISVAAMAGSALLRRRMLARYGAWDAALIAGAAYVLVMLVAGLLLPAINEVPEQFPAVALWQFRVASFGAQLIMWAAIGLIFGALTERASAAGQGLPRPTGAPR